LLFTTKNTMLRTAAIAVRAATNRAIHTTARAAQQSARNTKARRGLFAGGALLGAGAALSMAAPAMAEDTTYSLLQQIVDRLNNIERNLGIKSSANGSIELNPMAGFPGWDESNKSLTRKHLTPQVYLECYDKQTSQGNTFDRAIQSAVDNQDSGIGAYAGDEEAYEVFAAFFDPLIEDYHGGYKKTDRHVSDMDASKLRGNPDPTGAYVNSTRIRVGRNIRGLGLSPGCTRGQRREVERIVVQALSELEGDLSGRYYSLGNMSEEDRQQLVADHFLFKKGDRFLESCGANRDWPEARGIFHNDEKTFLVWVNEEDQMRIISMQPGADAAQVFSRLARGIDAIEARINAAGYEFAHNDHLGYIHSCPTNVGTGMRASVHVKIPNLSTHPAFRDICAKLRLQPRGIHGEHSQSAGGVVDLSNKERLGKSEVQLVQTMIDGVSKILELEASLANGGEVTADSV